MQKEPLRVGLIGLGQMGRNHLRILSLLKGVDIVFVSDCDEAAGRAAAKSHSVQFLPVSHMTMENVDALVICTPTITHESYIRSAVPTVENIFVEKPLTGDLNSTRAICDFAAANEINLQVGFIERYNPAVQQLKLLLAEVEQVVSIDFVRTSKLAARVTDVDVVVDLMIHDIDLALHLSGPVASVSAQGVAEGDLITFACASLIHENGRLSRIQASRITDKKMRRIQATCTDMFADCDLLRKEIVLSREAMFVHRKGSPLVITAREETVAVRPEEALLAELQVFVRNSRSMERVEVPGPRDAVDAMIICTQVQQAILEMR